MSMRVYAAEGFATFALVLVSAGAVVVDATQGGLGHVGACLAAGVVVMVMIYCVGDVSGAHLNPAVTIGFWAARRLPFRYVPGYVIAQLLGSLGAAALIKASYGSHAHLGATIPVVEPHVAFVTEAVCTLFLMYVILCVATGAKEKGLMAGVAIGGCVLMNCLWAGPLTGAAMNPARTFGPALLGDTAAALWLYCTAPFIGSALAVVVCRMTHAPGQCCRTDDSPGADPLERPA